MISLTLLDSNKFVQVTFTLRGIKTYLIHRVELKSSDLVKYNIVLASNYLEKLYSLKKEKICITELTNKIGKYMSDNYDIEKAKEITLT
jgi:hypothetical protein